MEQNKHTPTPYSFNITTHGATEIKGKGKRIALIVKHDQFGEMISDTYEVEANTEFIVKACNNHDKLVDALEYIVSKRNAVAWDKECCALLAESVLSKLKTNDC